MSDEKTIVLSRDGYANFDEHGRSAGAAITPGEILDFDANGDYVPHAGGAAATEVIGPIVAVEDSAREAAGDLIDDDYAADDEVVAWRPKKGDIFLGHVVAAANLGDPLELSATAGQLQVQTTGQVIGYADETVAAAGRIRVITA